MPEQRVSKEAERMNEPSIAEYVLKDEQIEDLESKLANAEERIEEEVQTVDAQGEAIEFLEAVTDRYREALEWIADADGNPPAEFFRGTARQALSDPERKP
jgi:hypothetical protein